MAHKFGEAFFNDMVDRGRRELGGLMYEGSNIAQPMYPLRGNYTPAKQLDGLEPSAVEPPAELTLDDAGKDDRDVGMERE